MIALAISPSECTCPVGFDGEFIHAKSASGQFSAAIGTVIACALAAAAFAEQVQPRLIATQISRTVSRVQDDFTPEQLTVGRNVSDYLKAIGVYGQN